MYCPVNWWNRIYFAVASVRIFVHICSSYLSPVINILFSRLPRGKAEENLKGLEVAQSEREFLAAVLSRAGKFGGSMWTVLVDESCIATNIPTQQYLSRRRRYRMMPLLKYYFNVFRQQNGNHNDPPTCQRQIVSTLRILLNVFFGQPKNQKEYSACYWKFIRTR